MDGMGWMDGRHWHSTYCTYMARRLDCAEQAGSPGLARPSYRRAAEAAVTCGWIGLDWPQMIALRILEQVWCTIWPPLAPSCGVNQKASTFPWPLAGGWQLVIGSGCGWLGAITVHNLNTGMLASGPGRGKREGFTGDAPDGT